MTVVVRDTPVRKFAIGTIQRAAGEDVITHTWPKNATICYMVKQGTFSRKVNEQELSHTLPPRYIKPPNLYRSLPMLTSKARSRLVSGPKLAKVGYHGRNH